MSKKVLFVHFRSGERDGVSLEIEKRRQIFVKLGHLTFILSGFDPRAKSKTDKIFVFKELDVKRKATCTLRAAFFADKIFSETATRSVYLSQEKKIFHKILKTLEKIKPDLIFVHNIFSTAYHLPATTGVRKALACYSAPVVAINHDFWWDNKLFLSAKYDFIKDILEKMPFRDKFIIKHQVINSIALQKLYERTKIKAQLIGDFFDFKQKVPSLDNYNQDFLERLKIKKNDLVVLHATRIVERKAIENAILFCRYLQEEIKKAAPFEIDRKLINKNSRVFLILNNFVEVDSQIYFNRLKILARKQGVNLIWIGNQVETTRELIGDVKIYSFFECYQFADLITYTSYWEGFGNQLLETFWAKKIPVVFEYPVYRSDLKKEGYQIISLGNRIQKKGDFYFVPDQVLAKAAKESVKLLKNKTLYQSLVKKNFFLAKKYHDISLLEADLKAILKQIWLS